MYIHTHKQNTHKIKMGGGGGGKISISVAKVREKSSFVCKTYLTPVLPVPIIKVLLKTRTP